MTNCFAIHFLLAVALVLLSLGLSYATTIYMSKACWATNGIARSDCSLPVTSVEVVNLAPQSLNIGAVHGWKSLHLLKDWNLTWVAEQQRFASETLVQLGKDTTFLVSHKDGESIAYHFLHDTVRSHPYLRFIVVVELSKASPIVAALIMKEAQTYPNVKLLTTDIGATNLYSIKLLTSRFVSSLYLVAIMNDQVFTDMDKIAEAVRLAKDDGHAVVALNGGETKRFEDTHYTPHYFAPTVHSCLHGDVPFIVGDFNTPAQRRNDLYESNFAEDHALVYRTKEFQSNALMMPAVAWAKEMYFLVAAAKHQLGKAVMAYDVQTEVAYMTPDRWLEAEDVAQLFSMRTTFSDQYIYHNALRLYGVAPVPDAFSEQFVRLCTVDHKLRFLVGRGMTTLVTSPLHRSRAPDLGGVTSFPALPGNTPIELLSHATRDLTPGTVTHLGMVLGLLAAGGDANYTIAFEWAEVNAVDSSHKEAIMSQIDGPEARLRTGRCEGGEAIHYFNRLRWDQRRCQSIDGIACLQLYVTGNLTFILQVSEVVMGKERVPELFPGWPHHPLEISVLPTSVTLLRHEAFQGLNMATECSDAKGQAFGRKYFSTPTPLLKLDCSIQKWRGRPVHAVSEWVVVEYEDTDVMYEYAADAEGGLRPVRGAGEPSGSMKQLVEDASLILRRCRFEDDTTSTSLEKLSDKSIRCKYYLWYWRQMALRHGDLMRYTSFRRLVQASFRRHLSNHAIDSSHVRLRVLPPCGRGQWQSHCELPQAPFTAGALVGLYTDATPVRMNREELAKLPPFSAPQLVTWAFRPLSKPVDVDEREVTSRFKPHNSIRGEMSYLQGTHFPTKRS